LSSDASLASATLCAALARGAAWLSCPFVAPADGARFWAERRDGGTVRMGGAAPAGPAVLRVWLPRVADIKLVRNGAPLHAMRAADAEIDVARPGVYRVEARIGGRLWLLSNPVHLR
jgi:hypothetical protein